MPIEIFPTDVPSVNTMLGLGNGRYNNEYFSIHDLGTDVINPLQNVVPVLLGPYEFFGPFVLNFLAFDGPYLNDSNTWDTADVTACKNILIEQYAKFSRYELHMFIDNDAPNVNEDNESQVVITHNKLITLATELHDYGVTYHGRLSAAAVQTLMESSISAFYTAIRMD